MSPVNSRGDFPLLDVIDTLIKSLLLLLSYLSLALSLALALLLYIINIIVIVCYYYYYVQQAQVFRSVSRATFDRAK